MQKPSVIFPVLGFAAGLLLLWVDLRPRWDDTGVLAGLIFLSAAAVGWLSGRYPWSTAFLVGDLIVIFKLLFGVSRHRCSRFVLSSASLSRIMAHPAWRSKVPSPLIALFADV